MLTTIIILSVLVAVLLAPYIYTLFKIIRSGWTIKEYIFIVKTLWLSIDKAEFLDLMEMIKRCDHYFDDDEEEHYFDDDEEEDSFR